MIISIITPITIQTHKTFKRMSPKYSVYVLDPYHPDAISSLQTNPSLSVVLPNDPKKSKWHEHADGVILRSETRLTEDDFAKASKLRVVVK